jgi:hypothetical protein
MGEGVAKLVRMQVGKAGLGTPAAKDLPDPVRAERTTLAEPQPGQVGVAVARTNAQVAVEGDGSLAAEGQGALATALPTTMATSRSRSRSARRRPTSSARRAPVSSRNITMAVSRRPSKCLPAQAASSRRRPSSGTIGTGCSGTIGGRIFAIGLAVISSSSSSQAYRMRSTL